MSFASGAVRLYLESDGRPIAHVAHDLGIHREALSQWVRLGEAGRDAAGVARPAERRAGGANPASQGKR